MFNQEYWLKLPAARGAAFACISALLFGLSTPLVQHFGAGEGPWLTAAWLYAGAAGVALLFRSSQASEAPLRRRHVSRLFLVALFGAVIGPAALAWGLQRTSAVSASLTLALEAVFTVLLATILYREGFGRRVGLAILSLTVGSLFLVFDQSGHGTIQVFGLSAVALATLAWAIDNTLSRPLADIDPGSIILVKAGLGSACSFLLAYEFDEFPSSLGAIIGLVTVGAMGYGLSLRFYLLGQRAFGAARTGSIFAAAPFIGALSAFILGERSVSVWLVCGGAFILAGVILHLTERHGHPHEHLALDHEHAHRHDDGHHHHTHTDVAAAAMHSHIHYHPPLTHSHPHAPDLHHGHTHE